MKSTSYLEISNTEANLSKNSLAASWISGFILKPSTVVAILKRYELILLQSFCETSKMARAHSKRLSKCESCKKNCQLTVWKLQKFTLTDFWQKIRENNVLLKKLQKHRFDEIFFHTMVQHSVEITEISIFPQCGNMETFSTIFGKNFVKVILLNKSYSFWFHGIL